MVAVELVACIYDNRSSTRRIVETHQEGRVHFRKMFVFLRKWVPENLLIRGGNRPPISPYITP